MGEAGSVGLTVAEDLNMLVPIMNQGTVDAEVVYDAPIQAPVTQGQQLGELVIKLDENLPDVRVPLIADANVATGGFGVRLKTAVNVLLDKVAEEPATDEMAESNT